MHGKVLKLEPGITCLIEGSFAVGATGAVGAITAANSSVLSIVRNSAGNYTITLKDTWANIDAVDVSLQLPAIVDLKTQLVAVTGNSVNFVCIAVAAPTDPASGANVYFRISARQQGLTSVPN